MLTEAEKFLADILGDDRETITHCHRVASYVNLLCKSLALPQAECLKIVAAALLHDIGKSQIPLALLQKPGKLLESEYQLIKQHPIMGAHILEDIDDDLHSLINVVVHHHERIDGCGYPEGLQGSEIPLGAKIIAIADAFDAMTSHRTYSEPVPLEQAVEEVCRNAGSQFDARLVNVFTTLNLGEAMKEQES